MMKRGNSDHNNNKRKDPDSPLIIGFKTYFFDQLDGKYLFCSTKKRDMVYILKLIYAYIYIYIYLLIQGIETYRNYGFVWGLQVTVLLMWKLNAMLLKLFINNEASLFMEGVRTWPVEEVKWFSSQFFYFFIC